jgi:tRNA (guanine37-N1)-methyltransferase
MKITILTLFPEMFSALNESIIGRAQKSGKVEIEVVNIRDFAEGKHKKCDDEIFGGGAGMLMMAEPIVKAVESVKTENSLVLYTSPKGEKLQQKVVENLANEKHIIIICGHYEGIDQRAIDLCVDKEISIGDYVLTGGELAAMVITDAVCRYVPDVITKESLSEESFSGDTLEYPQYTRPRVFRGLEVPEVLLSGNHAEIKKWREQNSKKIK